MVKANLLQLPKCSVRLFIWGNRFDPHWSQYTGDKFPESHIYFIVTQDMCLNNWNFVENLMKNKNKKTCCSSATLASDRHDICTGHICFCCLATKYIWEVLVMCLVLLQQRTRKKWGHFTRLSSYSSAAVEVVTLPDLRKKFFLKTCLYYRKNDYTYNAKNLIFYLSDIRT